MSPQATSTRRATRRATTICPRHDEPVADQAFVCDRCGEELRTALEAVAPTVRELPEPVRVWVEPRTPNEVGHWELAAGEYGRGRSSVWDSPAGRTGGLVRDLALTLTRQGVTGNAGGSSEQPVPWDERAAQAATRVTIGVREVLRVVVRDRGWDDAVEQLPLDVAAQRLLGQVDWLRHQHDAAVLVEGVVSAVREAQHVVDVQPDRLMCGPCSSPAMGSDGQVYICQADLRAVVGRDRVTCPTCRAEHDVAYRRGFLLAAVREETANASTLAAAVSRLGQEVSADRIRQWAARDRIVARDHDSRGRPLYRVGDVLDLLAEQAARRTTTQEEARP